MTRGESEEKEGTGMAVVVAVVVVVKKVVALMEASLIGQVAKYIETQNEKN